MVAQADHVEWVVVDSEVDALILEHSLIQAHLPRYNVRLKDDKSYPWLAVTLNEEWPRPAVVRGRQRTGVRYFAAYGNARPIHSTCWCAVFPSDVFGHAPPPPALGRPCLLYDIDRCRDPASEGRPHRLRPVSSTTSWGSSRHRTGIGSTQHGDAGGVGQPRVRAGGPAPDRIATARRRPKFDVVSERAETST
jgi:hypothetical protein